jgi:transposase
MRYAEGIRVMEYWAKPGLDRHQTLLLYPTLDESVSEHHPVRQLEEILAALDWSDWVREYNGRVGQPPISPWVMAGVIFYGLMRRIRSSRQLEYACGHNLDFMWLAEGRRIDHCTFCEFRTKFQGPLKELFKQVGRVAMKMGFIRLLEVAFDGTRVKANANRFHTWTAEKVEAVLQELETQVAEMLKEAEAADASEKSLRDDRLAQALPSELADARKRHEKMRQVLEELRAADAARKKDGIKTPAQMPKADTDSTVMPNKEGGYAPNYTPLAATDGRGDFIVDCEVIAGPNEQTEMLSSVDRIEENFGKKVENLSADKAFGTGANLAGMETRQVSFYTPIESPAPQEGNPAKRDDPRRPVPEAEWAELPRNEKQRLAKSCFVYDAAANCYYCPAGRVLNFEQTKREKGRETRYVYRCPNCEGCPLSGACRDPNTRRGRSVTRDEHEPLRERMHAKMQTEAAQTTYNRRMHIGETPFAVLKNIFEVRRFLLRGLEKVRTEWRWVCTAYNLKKLMAAIAALRAEGQKITVSVK